MTVGLIGKSLLGALQLGAGEGTLLPGFSLSPSAGHAVGVVSITATFLNGATSSATNTFSITSGPASGISAYVQVNSTTATFNLTTTSVSYTPIIIAESGTATSQAFSNAVVAPGAPTGLVGVAGNQQITFSFTAPADDGGGAITGYLVTASNGATRSGVGSPITVTGLANGTAYTATVYAYNAGGVGTSSSPSAGVTPNGYVGSNLIQQIGPFLTTDTLPTPGYRVFSGNSTLVSALVTTNIASITGISNGRLAAIAVPTDTYGGFHGYALWETGQTTNVYAPRELYLPPLFNPGSIGEVTKVTVFPYGTAMTSPGYQLYQDVGGTLTAVGSRVTIGVTAIPGVATGVSTDVGLTLNSDKSWRGIIVWDNGAGVYSIPDEVFIPPFSGFIQPTTTRTVTLTLYYPDGVTLRSNVTGLKAAWFDQTTPDTLTNPTDNLSGLSTNNLGVISFLVRTNLASGGVGHLLLSNSDGTTTQGAALLAFDGPVQVT